MMSPFKLFLTFSLLMFLLLRKLQATASKRQTNCRTINAAFSLLEDGSTFFLSGNEYIKYNFRFESEARVGPITELGLDVALQDVDAVFTYSNGSVYFLRECQFYRYQRPQQSEDVLLYDGQGSLLDLDLPCHVNAGINWNDDIFVFIGCDIWKLNPVTFVFELDNSTITRSLPCDIDAAVAWDTTGAIFVKGAQFWKFEDSMLGPFHTDDLHLCSWYLCGEADWMWARRGGTQKCNGDKRFCGLRLDQVTLAGLHNAGAGFAGGFVILNCVLRNHAENITTQLELGIRHLDIDPCHDTCGLLGTCHSIFCGGSICPIVKQVRTFLQQHRDEIITINFNHEITDPEKVFSRLNRQLQTQLGPMLNKRFRSSYQSRWPTLRRSIRSNQRVFIFYAPIIEDSPFDRFYRRYKWIHSEDLYGSTWRPFSVTSGCQGVVPLTAERCQVRQYRELVEVSIVPESGACVYGMADMCRQYLHQSLKACEPFRFQTNKSPNVLLVDYPEVDSHSVTSVFHAVYHQNVRNVIKHLPRKCQVKVDAAVRVPDSDVSLFFVGKHIQIYSHSQRVQTDTRSVQGLHENNIDAAYIVPNTSIVRIVKGCETWDMDAATLTQIGSGRTQMSPCQQVDEVVIWQARQFLFRDCHVTPQGLEPIPLADLGVPCNIDAVLDNGDHSIIYKGDSYWNYTSQGRATPGGRTLDWTVDAVQCRS